MNLSQQKAKELLLYCSFHNSKMSTTPLPQVNPSPTSSECDFEDFSSKYHTFTPRVPYVVSALREEYEISAMESLQGNFSSMKNSVREISAPFNRPLICTFTPSHQHPLLFNHSFRCRRKLTRRES